jgi:hypothetical protein
VTRPASCCAKDVLRLAPSGTLLYVPPVEFLASLVSS